MTNWEKFKGKVAECNDSVAMTDLIRTTELEAMDFCSRHLPDMTEFYKDNNPEAQRASIYGLEYYMRSEAE